MEVVSFNESLYFGLGTVLFTVVVVIGTIYFLVSRSGNKKS